MLTEVDYWLWFSLKSGIKHARRIELLEQFGSPVSLFEMTKKEMKKAKLTRKECNLFQDKDMSYAEAVKERCKEVGIHILTYNNPAYPEKLKEISDPPCVLYVRCKERINLNDRISIAMVGNREMTPYGASAADELASGLVQAGVVVVSGMAAGIDSASHRGAINGGGETVAVLGCGADVIYPPENEQLMYAIIEHGMVITEYPPGTPPIGKHFPARNRIISGLAEGVVVVEAPIRSGALITANHALKQNRDVFAVPGDIHRFHSRGCNQLISKGAILVNSAADVLKEYELVFRNTLKQYKQEKAVSEKKHVQKQVQKTEIENPRFQQLPETQRNILNCLSLSPVSLETLIEKTNLSADELSTELIMLEIDGLIRALPGKHFVLHA